MKAIKRLCVPTLWFAALLICGCSTNDLSVPVTNSGNIVIMGTIDIPQNCDDNGTRTAVDPNEAASGRIGINWLPGDRIGVYGNKGSDNVAFHNQNDKESNATDFVADFHDGEAPLYAYYPYREDAGTDPKALKGNLPRTQHYSTATRALDSDWKVGKLQSGSDNSFLFHHIFAFLRFEINAAGTKVLGEKLQSISLTIDGQQLNGNFTCDLTNGNYTMEAADATTDCVTLDWSDRPELSASTLLGYMNVAPSVGMMGKQIRIVIATNLHIISFSQTAKLDGFTANTYYTVPLTLANFEDKGDWTVTNNPDYTEENAEWIPGLQSRLACANTVFGIPGQPFMHKIRVPQNSSQTAHAVVPVKTGVKRVYNLPEGLTWNADRCLVQGTAPADAGEYTYSVEFEIDRATYKEGIHLVVSDNLHQPTPHMGWQSWNVLETKIDEASIMATADKMVENGWAAAGYKWIGIDDCWQNPDGSRDANGAPNINTTKFPNGMKSLTDYIHSKGLKAGIYSDCGTVTCASGSQAGGTMLGAYNYEAQTAKAFSEWGFDKLKEDWFWAGHGDADGTLDASDISLARELYVRMGNGIKAAGGHILLSMCEWGLHDPWKWGAEAGGSSWRMSYDHRDGWMGQNGTTGTIIKNPKANNPTENAGGIGLKNTIDLMRNLWSYVGINSFNDADMLVVGIRGGGTSSNDLLYSSKGSMGDTEYETEFAMWCMYSSPLLLTLDVRKTDLNSHDVALLKNTELITINQDPLAQGAEYVKTEGYVDYYQKDLANGDVAIAAVNLGDNSATYSISISDYDALDNTASYTTRNLIAKADAGILSASSELSGSLAAHGTFVVRLTKQ